MDENIVVDGQTYSPVCKLKEWKDNMKDWPTVTEVNVLYYLLSTKACDLQEMQNYKATEAYNYVSSGFVDSVFCNNLSSELVVLKAGVGASQTMGTTHNTWVCVRKCGEVCTGGCSCMAGRGKVCSHVAAILWKIVAACKAGMTGTSSTDLQAAWNRGTKRNIVPKRITNIIFKKPKPGEGIEISPTKDGSTLMKRYDKHEDMVEDLKKELAPLMEITGSILCNTVSANIITSEEPSVPTSNCIPAHQEPHTGDGTCICCNIFFDKYVNLSSEQCSLLETATRTQSSKLWMESRRLRITASTSNGVPKRVATSPANFLKNHVFGKFKGNAATEHGRICEPLALEYFTKETGITVHPAGTKVCESDKWLSASADGLIGDNAILEIKSPIRQNVKQIIASGKYDVKTSDDGKPFLCKNGQNGYYMQVQLTMHCTKRDKCFFLVWSKEYSVLFEVEFDNAYVSELIARLRKFYFVNLLPYLTDYQNAGILLISQAYANLCNKS